MPRVARVGVKITDYRLRFFARFFRASAAPAARALSFATAISRSIAAAATLAVVYPHMCSIGGDAFWLIYDAGARKVSYLDGGGRAAAAATLERFRGQKEIPFRGLVPATLTTP